MMNVALFSEYKELPEGLPDVEHAEEAFSFLELKLRSKGLGRVVKVIESALQTGTNGHLIFSGIFICQNGNTRVKCVSRQGKHKKQHWAVYLYSKK